MQDVRDCSTLHLNQLFGTENERLCILYYMTLRILIQKFNLNFERILAEGY